MALKPITRQEQIVAGKGLEPITRMERFLKDYGVSKYFGETTVKGDTLTWDGNTEGLDYVEGMYRLSDAIVTAEDIANGLEVTISDGNDTSTAETSTLMSNTSITGLSVNYNGTQFGMLVFAHNAEEGLPVGVYYIVTVDGVWMCSLTIPGYTGFETITIKPIDEKYLPPLVSPSGKKFKLSVDDSGVLSATEVTE